LVAAGWVEVVRVAAAGSEVAERESGGTLVVETAVVMRVETKVGALEEVREGWEGSVRAAGRVLAVAREGAMRAAAKVTAAAGWVVPKVEVAREAEAKAVEAREEEAARAEEARAGPAESAAAAARERESTTGPSFRWRLIPSSILWPGTHSPRHLPQGGNRSGLAHRCMMVPRPVAWAVARAGARAGARAAGARAAGAKARAAGAMATAAGAKARAEEARARAEEARARAEEARAGAEEEEGASECRG
jgi:hypothetical protein